MKHSTASRMLYLLVVLNLLFAQFVPAAVGAPAASLPLAVTGQAGKAVQAEGLKMPVPASPAALAAAPLEAPVPTSDSKPVPAAKTLAEAAAKLRSVPLRFVENVGQYDQRARFQVLGLGATVYLADDGVWFTVPAEASGQPAQPSQGSAEQERRGVNLRFRFENANPHPRLEPFGRQETHVSYFDGSDPAQWHADVPVWSGVRYVDLYPGVDLEVSAEGADWRWRIVPHDGADTSAVQLRVDGAMSHAAASGRLHIRTEMGDVALPAIEGVAATGQLSGSDAPAGDGAGVLGLTATESGVGLNNPSDLLFSTYLGSTSQTDSLLGIAVDAYGAVYLTGSNGGGDFPVTPGAYVTTTWFYNGAVAKLSPEGDSLLFGAYFGHGGYQGGALGTSVAVDPQHPERGVYVAGETNTISFPVTAGAFQKRCHENCWTGYGEGFLLKLNAAGTGLLYSTLIGGTGDDGAHRVVVDAAGIAYVVGSADLNLNGPTEGFPLTPDALSNAIGEGKAFFAKIDPSKSGWDALLYSTFLGGSRWETGVDIALGPTGSVYILGATNSPDFRSTAGAYAFPADPGTLERVFVAKLAPAGPSVEYIATLGGTTNGHNEPAALAVDGDGAAHLTGWTGASDFPRTTGAGLRGLCDAFVSKLSSDGVQLEDGTLLGGDGCDRGEAIGVGQDGAIYVGGATDAAVPFITADGLQTTPAGGSGWTAGEEHLSADGFLARLDAGFNLAYGTYLGGTARDGIAQLAVGRDGTVYLVGYTNSLDFPTSPGAFHPSYYGGYTDGFVSHLGTGRTSIRPEMALNVCRSKGSLAGEARGCQLSTLSEGAFYPVGDPINTQSGAVDYSTVDLSLPALGGQLAFQRSYSSLATDLYTTTLGFGWTHNQDTRLILPDSVGGVAGQVRFKPHNANQLIFYGEGEGPFEPYAGVLARLEKTTSAEGYRVTAPDQAIYAFDMIGRLYAWVDAQGHTWSYSYDGGRLARVADGSGLRWLDFHYDPSGRLASVSDPIGRAVQYGYDGNGDLTTVTDARGQVWRYRYDGSSHRLAEVVDPLGYTVERTEFDAQGRAVRQFDAYDLKTLEIGYHADGTRTVTDTLGHVTKASYGEAGTLAALQDAAGKVTTKAFDAQFRPARSTDPLGHTTQMAWSPEGVNLTQVVDAQGNATSMTYDSLNNLTRATDALGHSTVYTYTGKLLTASTNALGHTTTYRYTLEGLLETLTDPLGRPTHYTYNSAGQPTSVTDAAELTTSFAYDGVGRLITTTLPGGSVELRAYDPADQVIRRTQHYTTTSPAQNYLDEYNLFTTYGYDPAGRQVAITDTLGSVTRDEYDVAGRLVKTTENQVAGRPQNDQDQYNRVTTYGYDRLGNRVLVTDTLGSVTRTEYDALSRPVTVTTNYQPGQPVDAETNLPQVKTYDASGNVIRETDPLGHATVTEYDALNRPVKVTANFMDGIYDAARPDEDLASLTAYDELGRVIERTDPAGQRTTYTYDALGRLTATTDALSGVATTQYAADGQPLLETDAGGHDTGRLYDPAGRLVTVTDALGGATTTEYDAFGRRAATIDALGQRTAYSYSPTGRLLTTTDALGGVTTYQYDPLGRTVAVTDPLGRITRTAYDALGRAIEVTDALSGTVQTTYDILGRKTQTRDANGHETRYAYDPVGRLIRSTDASGRATRLSYDAGGNRLSTSVCGPTGACQLQASFSYDGVGRLLAQVDGLGHATRYSYDAVGNRVALTDANGVVTRYGHDALGRLTAVIENVVDGSSADHETNVSTHYEYDALGNHTVITNALGARATSTYDALARLTLASDPLGHTTRYGYDALGNRTVITDANGKITTYAYDGLRRPIAITYESDGQTVQYAYDPAGNRLAMTDTVGTTRYLYDALNRPISVTSPLTGTVSYRYDPAGNRTQVLYPGGEVVTHTYDTANRLVGVLDWAGQATSYGYDDAGRVVTTTLPNGVVSLNTYDAAGRLTGIVQKRGLALLAEYTYALDPLGNRVAVTETVMTPPGDLPSAPGPQSSLLGEDASGQTAPTADQRGPVARGRGAGRGPGLGALKQSALNGLVPPAIADVRGVARPFTYDAGDLVVTATTTLQAGTYNFTAITVTNGGRLVLAGDPVTGQGVTLTAQSLVVAAGGAVSADGLGYGAAAGPGAGLGAWTGAGASHGGLGGRSDRNATAGPAYGDARAPGVAGSGGGAGLSGAGGRGGGAVHLRVVVALRVDGVISADGAAAASTSYAGGGGSGGALWIETNQLEGGGQIRANGGAGNNGSGGGGGGRIAVQYQTSSFPAANYHSLGANGYGGYSGPGTVYLKGPAGRGALWVDNAGHNGLSAALLAGAYEFDTIHLTNYGHLRVLGASSLLTVTNDSLAGDASAARLSVEGRILAPAALSVNGPTVVVEGELSGPQTIQLAGTGGLELAAQTPWHTGSYTFTEISVGSGGKLALASADNGDTDYSNDDGLTLNLARLTVAAGGAVSADGLGYAAGRGPGAGQGAWTGAGASHGGLGGRSDRNATAGPAYGEPAAPGVAGSGGGAGLWGAGGRGGGAVHLRVTDTLRVEGVISADGAAAASTSYAGGGGSGGALWIETNHLEGSGQIRAHGGAGNHGSGGGGGGRIAVYASNAFAGSLSAAGGAGYEPGQAGTVSRTSIDPLRSALTAAPQQVASGESLTVTVSLLEVTGAALAGQGVALELVSGDALVVNGLPLPAGGQVSLGRTDAGGQLSASVVAFTAGVRVVRARASLVPLANTASLAIGVGAEPVLVTTAIRYRYDPLGRLVDAQYTDGRRFEYAYDAAGNRTLAAQTIPTTLPLTTTYRYDAANRLTAVDGRSYTWDGNGNLLDDGVKRYTYDQADRLVAITSTTGLVWSAQYDGDGMRLSQVVNGVPITYTLDLAAPLVTVLAQAQLNNRTTYVYGLGDSPLASDDGAAWIYLSGRDALNSVRQETDPAGRVLAARSFDPYGVPLSGDGGEPFGFTGEYRDEASGMLFLRTRYLQPAEGRFITRDTWPGDEMRPITLNAWAYGGANPVYYTDPTGHDLKDALDFLAGVLQQLAYDNASLLPLQQQTLATDLAQYSVSEPYVTGRHVGNIAACWQGAIQVVEGFGVAGGGVALCGTGALCPVGVAAVGVGAVSVANGGVILGNASKEELALLAKQSNSQPAVSTPKARSVTGQMLGRNGASFPSKGLWSGERGVLHVENPSPGQRPGQIHFQVGTGKEAIKWYYDPLTRTFLPSEGKGILPPNWLKDLLKDKSFQAGIDKGLKWLGEPH